MAQSSCYLEPDNWCIRGDNANFNPDITYAKFPTYFTLEFHHGGEFDDLPEFHYKGGKVDYIDKVNPYLFSVIIVNEMMQELGYSEEDAVVYSFREPGEMLPSGLRSLGSDSDVLKLIKYAESCRTVELYVQHIKTFPRNDLNTAEGKLNEPEYVVLSDNDSDKDNDKDKDSYKDSSGDEDSAEGSDKNSEDDDSDYLVDDDHIELLMLRRGLVLAGDRMSLACHVGMQWPAYGIWDYMEEVMVFRKDGWIGYTGYRHGRMCMHVILTQSMAWICGQNLHAQLH